MFSKMQSSQRQTRTCCGVCHECVRTRIMAAVQVVVCGLQSFNLVTHLQFLNVLSLHHHAEAAEGTTPESTK